MKTVFINCSPKMRLSASSWFLAIQRMFTGGKQVLVKLRTPADHAKVMEQLTDADAVVFAMPLYVDGIPSHVLGFLEKLERLSRETALHFRMYAIANNGFIEGRQNEPLMRSLEHFCARSGLTWCGGVGIGGGVMLNVTRILFVVDIAILLLNMVLSAAQGGSLFPRDALWDFTSSALILLYFNLGVVFYLVRMGSAIRRGTDSGRNTPAFLSRPLCSSCLPTSSSRSSPS